MAKKRIVNTRFWIDDYTSNLDPIEKLLFLYLLTNQSTEICGVYELPLKSMSIETGIEKEMVQKIINRFERDKKIAYKDGWVAVLNFTKHQTQNPSVEQGIQRCLAEVPEHILEHIECVKDSLTTDCTQTDTKLSTSRLVRLSKVKLSCIRYGELENVKLTEEEYLKLVDKLGENTAKGIIEELSLYLASKGDKYKSHYATILSWSKRKDDKNKANSKKVYAG